MGRTPFPTATPLTPLAMEAPNAGSHHKLVHSSLSSATQLISSTTAALKAMISIRASTATMTASISSTPLATCHVLHPSAAHLFNNCSA